VTVEQTRHVTPCVTVRVTQGWREVVGRIEVAQWRDYRFGRGQKTALGRSDPTFAHGSVAKVTVLRPDAVDARRLIFAKSDQTPLDRWNLLRKHLKPAAKKLGLSGVTWHLLRHSHATMLDVVGTPIGTMQALLGHSAPEITREIYLRAIPEEQRRAVESVERLVFGPKLDPSLVSNAEVSETVH
jgi:integrase